MPSQDPCQVLKDLDDDLRSVLMGGRLVQGGEPYLILLTTEEARAIRELLKAYKQSSRTTFLDRLKIFTGFDER